VRTAAPRPDTNPSRWIAFPLAGALVLSALLAWQAQDAALSHRRAAEGVLRDYAGFAGHEFLRRARNQTDYYAFYPVIYQLSAHERSSPGSALPDPEDLARAARDAGRDRLPARSFYRVDLASGRVASSPGAPPEIVLWTRENLPGLLAQRASDGGEIAAVSFMAAGTPRTIVYGVSLDAARLALAFEVDPRDLTPFFQKSLAAGPLIPASSSGDGNLTDLVSLQLSDAWGREIFHSGGAFDPAFGTSEKLTDPAAGIFRGMTLRASVSRSLAPRLVIGGLPRSRLPLLLMALALASGLLAAAIFLFRRERALADLRSDFVSSVSHELRTPLAQIRLFAETLLLDRIRSPEERRRSLEIIDCEARRLTQLVENTLQFSRSERGAIALDLEPRDVALLVRQTLESFAPLAEARRASFRAELPETLTATVDEGAVRQVVLNLLDNAVKYGPAGQEILVTLKTESEALRLSVEDQGPGIPAKDRERIWRKFVRLERDRETHEAGAGIGLAVVSDLVALHNGCAWVEDGRRGGCRFVVLLPVNPKAPQALRSFGEGGG
jgi:signal transduction histidine kinase